MLAPTASKRDSVGDHLFKLALEQAAAQKAWRALTTTGDCGDAEGEGAEVAG